MNNELLEKKNNLSEKSTKLIDNYWDLKLLYFF